MATTFLEPGGDVNFNVSIAPDGFWGQTQGTPTLATDFVHGTHIKSLQFDTGSDALFSPNSVVTPAGGRISLYVYFATLPTGFTEEFFCLSKADTTTLVSVAVTTAGVLQIHRDDARFGTQIGSDGATLSTGTWYRICLVWTIASTTVNEFRLFKDGVQTITATNATISATTITCLNVGNNQNDTGVSMRISDIYIDDSTALTDTGNIWVTAKRPNANGTTNGFSTQIGAGGSGYGTGHSPQVNERPQSQTNGWSMIGAGSAVTEEYNIEGKSTGDISIGASDTIVDYMGWVYAKALVSETGSMVLGGASSNIALTSTPTVFTTFKSSSSYPAGTGTDIGIITSTTVTTVSLYECGIVVAFIPAVVSTSHNLTLLGIGT